MKTVRISEFKAKCLKMISNVHKTKVSLVITKRGQPVAELVPYEKKNRIADLRGGVKRYGDILSPIDEKWNASR